MLYYNRIDISEEIDVDKTSKSKECDICHYWYFFNKFKFRAKVCNRYYDITMMSMNLSDMAISNIEGADYWSIISRISKSDAINLIQNINLTKNSKIF